MPDARNLGDTLAGGGSEIALIDMAAGSRRFSFDELNDAAAARAAEAAELRGQRVGLLGANSAALVAALFGVMRAGAVAVPMSTKLTNDTLAFITRDAELATVYVDEQNAGRLPAGLSMRALHVRPPSCDARPSVRPEPNEAGLVLYTSGSTGPPKGVELSHASQWSMIDGLKSRLGGATAIVAAPLYHMNGLLFLMSVLAGRGTVVLMPRFDARNYLQAIHDWRVNIITGVPTMLSLLLKETDLLDRLDLTSVAAIQVGSAPLSETLIEQVSVRFPNARISNGYGTTEAGAGMFGPHPEGIAVPSASLGHPQPHVGIRLVGGTHPGEGVLEVLTPAAMNRYLNLPDKTAAKLSSDGWINTGDIMRRDAHGFFYFVGRADDMFKCGGESVYPGEVERVLEADPRIAESCVIPVPDDVRGFKPVAFVTIAMGHHLTEQAVKDVALAGAPAFMHPRHVFFVETMPLAGTNKIDRRALIERATALLS